MKPKLSPIEREAFELFKSANYSNPNPDVSWRVMSDHAKLGWLRLGRRVRRQVKKAGQKSYRKAMSHTLSPMTGLH